MAETTPIKTRIRSMTGFGRGEVTVGDRRIAVELRAVNHRFADVRLRLPQALTAHERELRQIVLDVARRGRIEGWVHSEPLDGATGGAFNEPLFAEIRRTASRLGEEHGIGGSLDLPTVLSIPGLFRGEPCDTEWSDAEVDGLREALRLAVGSFDADRAREGAALREVIRERAAGMRELAHELAERAGQLPSRLKSRLEERLGNLAGGIELDPQRVAQEAVLLAERADVTEELDRLRGHLEQLGSLVVDPGKEPLGKRLEFLLQEIHRETNTINSKSADLDLTRLALQLKSEAEKVREQVLNLE